MKKKIDISVSPYNDDFDEDKNFYQILFNPSRAVQARELTQIQSVLQNQVSTFADHVFKDGSMVLPGKISYDEVVGYVKLESQYNLIDIDVSLILNKELEGQTSGVKARVIAVSGVEGSDPDTIWVKYISSGTTGESQTFADGEDLLADDISYRVLTIDSNATGNATAASINAGYYYVNGYFAAVPDQIIILDKYTDVPSYKVGLEVIESIVDSDEDSSLTDPANDSSNFNAVGADRYSINLVLSKRTLDTDDEQNFVELLRINAGTEEFKVTSSNYSVLNDTLARRTFDESGNYSVRDFKLSIEDHDTEDTKLKLGLENGKAYVKGYEIETISTSYIDADRARDFNNVNNSSTFASLGNYVFVSGLYNIPTITNFPLLDIRDATSSGGTAGGSSVGSARVRNLELFSGIAGSGSEVYKLYIYDLQMDSGKTFYDDAKSFYISGSPAFHANSVVNGISKTELEGTDAAVSVFPISQSPVKSIRSESSTVDTSYSVKRQFTGTTNGSGEITFNANSGENFSSYSAADYSLSITDGANIGDLIDLTGKVSLSGSPTGNSVTITLTGFNTTQVSLIATVTKQVSQEKTKTVFTDNLNVSTPTNTISLARADVFEIEGIYDSGSSGTNATSADTDITLKYILDNGQRDNFYDLGSITLKPGETPPSGRILIAFKYFSHGAGDYFSVDSYSSIDYADIPSYSAADGQIFELRDCFDFRPRVSNAGTNFTGTGSSTIECVQPESVIRADFSYYLPRVDRVYLDSTGKFGISKGVSSGDLIPPAIPSNAMALYTLYLKAYTFTTRDVSVKFEDNRRYTMRDIGALEKRLSRLEYYTTISLLEKNTSDKTIIDSTTGLDRFKNGFVVDGFTNHTVCNTSDQDFKCSLDLASGYGRPTFYKDNFELEYSAGNSVNVQKTGDLITLPYTTTSFINQPYASTAINVNPYSVFAFIGTIKLDPSSDEWIDTETLPAQNLTIADDLTNGLTDLNGQTSFTVWNDWETQWTGETVGFTTNEVRTSRMRDAGGVFWFNNSATIRSTELGQTRTGSELTISSKEIQTNIGERIVSVENIPYIRSREIEFDAEKFKPDTRLYPFFDNVDVSDVVKPTDGDFGDALITDSAGRVSGTFEIPNSEELRFRTGERVLKLTDSAINSSTSSTSGIVIYSASGLLQTKQETIISSRIPQVTSSQVFDTQVISDTSVTTNSRKQYLDPLAQTFLVTEENGCFLTSLKLWFRTKDDNIPVSIQIRNTANGYPGSYILPFSEVIVYPEDITTYEVPTDEPGTEFTFESPVYLLPGTEYSIVVISDSNNYEAWTAKVGEIQIGTNNTISQQPYAGSLFKSQNASTWTADQTSDMMFELEKAVFDTSVSGNLALINSDIETKSLIDNPFTTTSGSASVVVFHPNHGFSENSSVTISSVAAGSYNGFDESDFNDTFSATNIELDRYTITMGSNATNTGATGGSGAEATRNILMDVVHPMVQDIVLPNTLIEYGYRGTTGNSVNGTQSAYIKDSTYYTIENNQNTELTVPELVASPENSTLFMGGDNSFDMIAVLESSDPNISPVIDLDRCSVITVNNRTNSPTDSNVGNFVDETVKQGGSSAAKYITKAITLADAAIGIKLFLDVSRPTDADVEVYYRSQSVESETKLEDKEWTAFELESNYTPSDNSIIFNEYEYLADDISPFSSFQIKIVFKSTNSSRVPLISNMRAIALGT